MSLCFPTWKAITAGTVTRSWAIRRGHIPRLRYLRLKGIFIIRCRKCHFPQTGNDTERPINTSGMSARNRQRSRSGGGVANRTSRATGKIMDVWTSQMSVCDFVKVLTFPIEYFAISKCPLLTRWQITLLISYLDCNRPCNLNHGGTS